MSRQLSIDPFVFARESRNLQGEYAVSDLLRLHDQLTDTSGRVTYQLQGLVGERGQLRLRLLVDGKLFLCCQRCLGGVEFALDVENLLELVADGDALSQDELEDDSLDFLPVAGELDVMALVEDEILLALPLAPRHEKCNLPSAAEAGEAVLPFSSLAGLKSRLN